MPVRRPSPAVATSPLRPPLDHPDMLSAVRTAARTTDVAAAASVTDDFMLKHPDIILEEEEDDEDEPALTRRAHAAAAVRPEAFDDYYDVAPECPRKDSDDLLAKFLLMRRARDRSKSLPAVHGQFVLVNRAFRARHHHQPHVQAATFANSG